MSDPTIQSVPLDQLEISTANARTTGAGKSAHTELKASIAAHGLIENLVARSLSPDSQGKPRYAVIAGGRRLSALTELANDGVLAQDHPVPCIMMHNGTADAEISLAENLVRAAMHPADQVQAFSALVDEGESVAGIAARFGVSERTVEQRLRLGNAAPEIIDAYRADELNLDTLKAFAVTADRARQMAVWEQIKEQGHRPSAWQVKRMLTQDRIPAGSAIASFVGVDAYETAGGIVDRDLFADQDEHGIWFEDADLLSKLAMERLQTAADELATRWKWAEPRIETDWSELARFGRVRATPGEATDEEKAEVERLHLRHDELINMDEDEWTEELTAEAETVETRLAEIEAAVETRAVFSTEHMAIAGCIVTIGHDGNMQLVLGLVKPEDIPAPNAGAGNADTSSTATPDASSGNAVAAPTVSNPAIPARPSDPEVDARKQAGVGIGLADDLRSIRTALVKAHLAGDFEAAFDLMLYQMGRAVFTPAYHDHALDIAVRPTADRPPLRANDDAFHHASPGEAMLADHSSLSFDWLTIEDRQDSFAALRALPEDAKRALFAACVARTLKGQLAFEANARPETETTVARLDIDFAPHVRPTADIFWSRIRKDRMLAVARDTLGADWAQAHRKDKKTELSDAMEGAFARTDSIPQDLTEDGRAAALAWTLPGFDAFDSGHIDEPEDTPAAPAEPTTSTEATAGTKPAAPADISTQPSPAVNAEPADSTTATETQPSATPADDAPAAAPAPGADNPAPSQPATPASEVESIVSPGVADRNARRLPAATDTMNAAPTADASPRVIISTVGFENDTGERVTPHPDKHDPAMPENGVDATAAGDALDIPAFLRRS